MKIDVRFNQKFNVWEAFYKDESVLIPNWTPDDVGLSPDWASQKTIIQDKYKVKRRIRKMKDKKDKKCEVSCHEISKTFEEGVEGTTISFIVVGLYRAVLEMMKYAEPGSSEMEFGSRVIQAYSEYEPECE